MSRFPSAILLDMDGTLFDSEAMYKRLWQKTAKDFGIDLNDKLYQRFVGAHFNQCKRLMQDIGGEGFSLTDFLNSMARREDSQRPPLLKPGATEFLAWIQKQAIPVALVTSSSRHNVEHNFSILGGTSCFQAIVTGEDVQHPKPEPEPYLLACRKLGIPPQQTIAVEDSNSGARSAISAGCQTIFVPDVLPAEEDVKENVAAILHSLALLPVWLKNQQKNN